MKSKMTMEDFRFKGSEFWSYAETCRKAKVDAIQPIEKPDRATLEQMQKIMDRTLPIYASLIPGSDNPLLLMGVFVYAPEDQTSDLHNTLAFAEPLEDSPGYGIVGLSTNLLEMNCFDFAAFVFLHELCHLCSSSGHDEAFQAVFNAAALKFFTGNTRMDSATARLLQLTKGWKW